MSKSEKAFQAEGMARAKTEVEKCVFSEKVSVSLICWSRGAMAA